MKIESCYRVGDCEVFKVIELETLLSTSMLYPEQQLANNSPEEIMLSVHSWIVRTPSNTLIIDTESGNGRERPGSPVSHQLNTSYEHHLREKGIEPDKVDYVLMTHLHGDHVGWNTHLVDGKWMPLFSNARYYCSEIGLKNWQKDPSRKNILEDSINPIIDADLLETIDLAEKPIIAELLTYIPTPGHSPDHASIILQSAGEYALFTGDLMHNEIQVKQPHLASRFCADAKQAEIQRRWAMEWAADHQALCFSSHFASTSAGYVTRVGDGFEWRFV
ncbi:MBL fold metallo-hydrolase [Brenneria goodwinii]|uniref:MBL fold metallo-hydrolase n=1 Tax=Brenneria goodwinii TaxID=1109412 RepID=UPI000EF18679|nr:MBL fold metallo-hydrolase [Brenneria goodwinii]MCG8155413.1 MBL fold metallo-hydrolase [Brenneria goodwinii]MCG8161613.1 MBL fold metallo-hydrolase [Brenneria goodwinii]MCG8166040.1 MBL fold metallo-hydrolase [Brenneria goodwinii]MCG8169260.1 MBL fold metallo-hydrolase [Brenneria goodwinii]MCG8175736.1 MBL fold metallo-hydrolase [Brenneria goodwinii]